MDSLTQDLADLIPVSEKLKKENDEFKLEIESLKQTIEEGENERIQMLRNDILFSFLSVNSDFLGGRPYTVYLGTIGVHLKSIFEPMLSRIF